MQPQPASLRVLHSWVPIDVQVDAKQIVPVVDTARNEAEEAQEMTEDAERHLKAARRSHDKAKAKVDEAIRKAHEETEKVCTLRAASNARVGEGEGGVAAGWLACTGARISTGSPSACWQAEFVLIVPRQSSSR